MGRSLTHLCYHFLRCIPSLFCVSFSRWILNIIFFGFLQNATEGHKKLDRDKVDVAKMASVLFGAIEEVILKTSGQPKEDTASSIAQSPAKVAGPSGGTNSVAAHISEGGEHAKQASKVFEVEELPKDESGGGAVEKEKVDKDSQDSAVDVGASKNETEDAKVGVHDGSTRKRKVAARKTIGVTKKARVDDVPLDDVQDKKDDFSVGASLESSSKFGRKEKVSKTRS